MADNYPKGFYDRRISELQKELGKHKNRHRVLGWLRLIVVALPLLLFYLFWPLSFLSIATIAMPAIAIFLWLVAMALEIEKQIKNTDRLLTINREELLSLAGNNEFRPDGATFLSTLQLSDNDLDLFGRASVFQMANRSVSEQGQVSLALAMTNRTTKSGVLEKQNAVRELAPMVEWRQQLQSFSMQAPISHQTFVQAEAWIRDENAGFDKPVWHAMRWAVPIVSCSILLLYIAGTISDGAFNTAILLMLAFVLSWYKALGKQQQQLSKILPQLNSFSPLLQWIENTKFQASILKEKQQLLLSSNRKASQEIDHLKKILNRFEYRLNPLVYLPLSVFLFWDLQQVLALEKWKKNHSGQLEKWFEALGEFEMISSLANLHFNKPAWQFPEITDNWFDLECRQAGHPLIPESRLVRNDFAMKNPGGIALVTGSNMAGKSTFLRTIGSNMILAMTGAPVCADYMRLPIGMPICSMRIADNLEEETSTFYAELKKIKRIVDAVQGGEKVFVLIDEMLRGTNTYDRHTGSVALIRQLIKQNGVGIIASHDTALASLESEFPGTLQNYHFDSSIVNGEIIFDFKLKQGVCTSTNASLLMKKIGIDMDGA